MIKRIIAIEAGDFLDLLKITMPWEPLHLGLPWHFYENSFICGQADIRNPLRYLLITK